MAEQMNNKEADSQRLRAIEKQNGVLQTLKRNWQDDKDTLAQSRKAFEEAGDTLSDMITPPVQPLLDQAGKQKTSDAQK